MENKFVSDVVNQIINPNAKKPIQAELESHILDKADYYMEIGYSKDDAFKRATEEMGDAYETAVPLNKLNDNPYNAVFNILSFIALVAIVIFYNKNNFYFSYVGDNLYYFPHYISLDFISTFIFACYILLLWLSHKLKSKAVPIMIILSFIAMAFFSFQTTHFGTFQNSPTNAIYIFQPMSYSIITILTKGISQYINSIFGYSYVVSDSLNYIIYNALSITFLLVIIATAIIVFVSIYKLEHLLKSIKTIHIYKHILKFLSLLVAVNIAVISACTVIAYKDIENKIEESKINRAQMINYVVNADITIDLEQQIKELKKSGFDVSQEIAVYPSYDYIPYAYQIDNNLIKLAPSESDKYEITFESTNYEDSLLDKQMLCNKDEKKFIQSFKSGDKLQDFLQNNIYTKACEVSKSINYDNKESISFVFAFYEPYYDDHFEEWFDITYYYVYFENGILVEY